MSVSTISPKQLQDRIQAGETVDLIDVRTPVEFREVHASIASNVPQAGTTGKDVVNARKNARLGIATK